MQANNWLYKKKKKFLFKNFFFFNRKPCFNTYDIFKNLLYDSNAYIQEIWGFKLFWEKFDISKKQVDENSRIRIVFLNENKLYSEQGNILTFSQINMSFKPLTKKISMKFRPKPLYINYQHDINQKMRAILIDWLIDVHSKFKLIPATLFLTVNLIDRFLSMHSMIRQQLQLLGISSMLLASKYEEIYAPETKDFVYISDNAYSKEDIFRMEILICKTLNYTFQIPSPIFYISDFSKILNASQEEIIFSIYNFELHLIEYKSLVFQVDIISLGSILNSICLLNDLKKDSGAIDFFKNLYRNSINFQSIKDSLLMGNSLLILNQNGKRRLTSLKRKYSHKKYKEVSEVTFFVYFKHN